MLPQSPTKEALSLVVGRDEEIHTFSSATSCLHNNENVLSDFKESSSHEESLMSQMMSVTTASSTTSTQKMSSTTSPTSVTGESSCSLCSISSLPLSTGSHWRERLFPTHFIQKIANSSISNFKSNEVPKLFPTSYENSNKEVTSSKTTLETELLDYLAQELSSMNDDELESITVPDVVDYLTRDLRYSSKLQKCSLIHLAARNNRVELLQWMKRCCCDKKCVLKPIPKVSMTCSDKKELPSSSPMFECSFNPFKRLSRNFGRNFNIATQHVEHDDHQNSQHSKSCLARQHQLWSVQDQNLATPLFYTCYDYSSVEAAAFLLSQPTVAKQLNHHHDDHGNLPITIGFRNKNFKLCDLLVLFGARIDVTSGLLGESLLHRVCRDGDIDSVKYLAQHSSKIILKRNQRDECALFACITDLRTKAPSSSPTGLFLSVNQADSPLSARKGSIVVSENSCNLLHNILINGVDLFGKDIFEKAVQMKNSFGQNLLMKSIVYNDLEAMKVICLDISNYCQSFAAKELNLSMDSNSSSGSNVDMNTSLSTSTEDSSRKRSHTSPKLRIHSRTKSQDKKALSLQNILKSIVFDSDKKGKTIMIQIVELGITIYQDNTQEEAEAWFDGFQWLLMWLFQNFSLTLNNKTNGIWTPDCGLSGFFEARDNQGISAYSLIVDQQPEKEHNYIEESPKTEDESSLFWPRVLECIHNAIAKWSETEKVKDVSQSSVATSGATGNDIHQPKPIPLSQKSKSFRYTEEAYDMSGSRSRSLFASRSDSTDSSSDSNYLLGKLKKKLQKSPTM
ncbi:hypothetical protein C9374_008066 [Naegleria lovaniensis]|uniref:Uncharacterized protein n=1 Tax=Naegleria lovaniensis TaxID=51637 RepID=A0AA88GFC7_NAELO|nr:uncharacterized protein C9374_008066 [Naegleria lovaniensis]KAG2378427.1 hypothetical protein C9374_008066 [Naegleria lovaniensis]